MCQQQFNVPDEPKDEVERRWVHVVSVEREERLPREEPTHQSVQVEVPRPVLPLPSASEPEPRQVVRPLRVRLRRPEKLVREPEVPPLRPPLLQESLLREKWAYLPFREVPVV